MKKGKTAETGDEHKAHKLERALQPDLPVSGRLKRVVHVLDNISSSEERAEVVRRFQNEMYNLVLSQTEQMTQVVASGMTQVETIEYVARVMSLIFECCGESIQNRWQNRSLGLFCDRLLAYSNPKFVRCVGFDMLVMHLSALGAKSDFKRSYRVIEALRLQELCTNPDQITQVFGHNKWDLASSECISFTANPTSSAPSQLSLETAPPSSSTATSAPGVFSSNPMHNSSANSLANTTILSSSVSANSPLTMFTSAPPQQTTPPNSADTMFFGGKLFLGCERLEDTSGREGSERQYMLRRLMFEMDKAVAGVAGGDGKAQEMFELWFHRIFARLLLAIAYPAALKRAFGDSQLEGFEHNAGGFELSAVPRVLQVEIVPNVQKWLSNTTSCHNIHIANEKLVQALLGVLQQSLHHPHFPPPSLASSSLFLYIRWIADSIHRPAHVNRNVIGYLKIMLDDLCSMLQPPRMILASTKDVRRSTVAAWESAVMVLLCVAQSFPTPAPVSSNNGNSNVGATLTLTVDNHTTTNNFGQHDPNFWRVVLDKCLNCADALANVALQQGALEVVRAFEVAARAVFVCIIRARCTDVALWDSTIFPKLRLWLTIDQISEALCRQWQCAIKPLIHKYLRVSSGITNQQRNSAATARASGTPTTASHSHNSLPSPSTTNVATPTTGPTSASAANTPRSSHLSDDGAAVSQQDVFELETMGAILSAMYEGGSNNSPCLLKMDCSRDVNSVQLADSEAYEVLFQLKRLLAGSLASVQQGEKLQIVGSGIVSCISHSFSILLDNSKIFKVLGVGVPSAACRAGICSLITHTIPMLHTIALAPPSCNFFPTTCAEAVRMLCDCYCTRGVLSTSNKEKNLGLFTEVVLRALFHEDSRVVSAAIIGCKNIFSQDDTPGVQVLLVPLLLAISRLPLVDEALVENARPTVNLRVVDGLWATAPFELLMSTIDAALTLAVSLITFPNVVAKDPDVPAPTLQNKDATLPISEVKSIIVDLLLFGFSNINASSARSLCAGSAPPKSAKDPEQIKRKWLWSLTVFLREHLRRELDPSIPLVVRSKLIDSVMSSSNETTTRTACDCLVEYANALRFASSQQATEFATEVVARLCAHIVGKVTQEDTKAIGKGTQGANSSPSSCGVDAEYALAALLNVCFELEQDVVATSHVLAPIASAAFTALKSQLTSTPVVDAATAMLDALDRILHTFPRPPPLQPDVMASMANEPGDQSVMTLLRDSSLVSLCNNAEDPTGDVNIVVRDWVSKHAWRVRVEHNTAHSTTSDPTTSSTGDNLPTTLPPPPPTTHTDSAVSSFEDVVGTFTMGFEGGVNESRAEEWWNNDIQTLTTDELVAVVSALPKHSANQNTHTTHRDNLELEDLDGWLATRALTSHVLRTSRPDHLTLPQARTREMVMARGHSKYDALMRNVKFFDDARPRETLKIGVIYVPEGCEDQLDALKLQGGSEQYRAFVDGLGWQVPLDTHQGFNGKLDKSLSTGTHAPYYADALRELTFHVTTQMPTSTSDPRQIHKKRHVGNDQVHIVFSEHTRDYRAEMITSQFNDAHVIVYPLSHNRYCIQTSTKKESFGPLCDGMVVHKSMGPLLVRRTAINADCMVRRAQYGHSNPFATRKQLLTDLVAKFCDSCSADTVLERVFCVSQPQRTLSMSSP